ncbi:related to Acylpyruvase FAHD1, mitochondrial [Melanopsichium pennsylvanicum]|uniref:Related to Acylpyruvase FAHD1, mitochondrial n=2 Tax=Melanopsichium pennsylvanicum TaxID=63383 RepID=A0AAJ5C438_9BASI|nr:mitochondrial protein [Melanopsichium pennsylvanicum 4]SNX83099.1 related to Acylpyruvase FAHD1, mitochondrial [Melanopsichium pennsylvanicum]
MASFLTRGKKIVAIGRNYAAHAKELNNAVPTEPFFFLKPTTSYISNNGTVEIPKGIVAHYEVELGVVIGSQSVRAVSAADAMNHVAGYTLSIDMTARNLQEKVKSKGLPWSTAKGFDTFTPTSGFIDKSRVRDPSKLKLWLKVNDQIQQNGTTGDMIFDIPQLIEHVSSIMTLEQGDLLLTGTPQGVGEVKDGDTMFCGLEDQNGNLLEQLKISVANRVGGYEFKP